MQAEAEALLIQVKAPAEQAAPAEEAQAAIVLLLEHLERPILAVEEAAQVRILQAATAAQAS